MGDTTSISWADRTYSPWRGCQKVSPACEHCYAEERDNRYEGGLHWGPHAGRIRAAPATLYAPLRWQREALVTGRRTSVFCASLADWADTHGSIDPAWRRELASTIIATPNLDWLLLTKRIGNVPALLHEMFRDRVPQHLRVGATIANQEEWNRDAEKIAAVAALTWRLPFLSMEPLLSDVTFHAGASNWYQFVGWVLVGGESGRHARSMPLDWPVNIRRQCVNAGVPFHMKQLSQADYPKTYGDPDYFPEELQAREFPRD